MNSPVFAGLVAALTVTAYNVLFFKLGGWVVAPGFVLLVRFFEIFTVAALITFFTPVVIILLGKEMSYLWSVLLASAAFTLVEVLPEVLRNASSQELMAKTFFYFSTLFVALLLHKALGGEEGGL